MIKVSSKVKLNMPKNKRAYPGTGNGTGNDSGSTAYEKFSRHRYFLLLPEIYKTRAHL